MNHIFHRIQPKKLGFCLVISLIVIGGTMITPVHADSSFTGAISFYQGVDVTTGMTERDPSVLTLLFGESGQLDQVLTPEVEKPFTFSPAADFYFSSDPAAMKPVIFVPEQQIVAMAVLDELPVGNLDAFLTTPFTTALDADSFLFFKTADNHYFQISNISQISDFSDLKVNLTLKEVSAEIPEPATLGLLGLGLIGLVGLARMRKKRS
jgi:hypothetical protein